MDYYKEKAIVMRLQEGVVNHVAAQFLKNEEEFILDLIANDMVKKDAFLMDKKIRYGLQNLKETSPVTGKGKTLFGMK